MEEPKQPEVQVSMHTPNRDINISATMPADQVEEFVAKMAQTLKAWDIMPEKGA